jgi:microcompartment protein CcmK/EutM
MILGRVVASITSTINHPFYDAKKLLVVERTDPAGHPQPGYVVAVDTVDAGVGDRVLVLDEGTGARQVFGIDGAPVRSVIVGIVDAAETTG